MLNRSSIIWLSLAKQVLCLQIAFYLPLCVFLHVGAIGVCSVFFFFFLCKNEPSSRLQVILERPSSVSCQRGVLELVDPFCPKSSLEQWKGYCCFLGCPWRVPRGGLRLRPVGVQPWMIPPGGALPGPGWLRGSPEPPSCRRRTLFLYLAATVEWPVCIVTASADFNNIC